MNDAPATHLTFSLRLWRGAGADDWRITLYDAQTGTYLRFASLAQLDAFLHIVTRSATVTEQPLEQPEEPRPLPGRSDAQD